ncbi:hypothetical protein [Streptomyces sp. NPDC001787]|uniref:hypothetical protein n=1 Tax=Streptomyces sp. NPDC001787 TaxID=3154523 RepID=UPI00332E5F1D
MSQHYTYLTEVQWGTGAWTPPEWRPYHSGNVTLGREEALPEFLERAPASPQEIIDSALNFTAWLVEDECRARWISAASIPTGGPAQDSIQRRRPPTALRARVSLTPLPDSGSETSLVEERILTVPPPTLEDIARFRGDPIVARNCQDSSLPPARIPFAGPDEPHPAAGTYFALLPGRFPLDPHLPQAAEKAELAYLALFDGDQTAAVLPIVADGAADLQAACREQAALLEPWVPTVLLLARSERLPNRPHPAWEGAARGNDTAEGLEAASTEAVPDAETGPLPPFVRSWHFFNAYGQFWIGQPVWRRLSSIVVRRWASAAPSEGRNHMIRWAIDHGYPSSALHREGIPVPIPLRGGRGAP